MEDLTPKKFRCLPLSVNCPVVVKDSRESYIIIGKTIDPSILKDNNVGEDESAVQISAELLETALSLEKLIVDQPTADALKEYLDYHGRVETFKGEPIMDLVRVLMRDRGLL